METLIRSVNTRMYGAAMSERLTKDDWIAHGLRTLASGGTGALKVGAMADALSVSRGSFYWHFTDIGDFKRRLLERWQELATEQVIRELEEDGGESDRLRRLMHRALREKNELDRAVRIWAADEEEAAAFVAAVDDRRISFIAHLLAASGVDRDAASGRAKFIYWAYLGRSLVAGAHDRIDASTVDAISALFENRSASR
jgi:AcrR family transcriptional regulator